MHNPTVAEAEAFSPDMEESYLHYDIVPSFNYAKWEQHREWQAKVMHFVTMTGVRILIAAALFHLVKAMVGR